MYDEFWTQSGRRMLGFSDVPFEIPDGAPSYHGTCEAKYLTQYLEDYVDSHVYSGKSLRSRILLSHTVSRIERLENAGWIAAIERNGDSIDLRCSKLVVATGFSSQARMPNLPNQNVFKGRICHHRDFGRFSRTRLKSAECKNIIILGSGKSATDMAYEAVKKGKHVSWILRRGGTGPALFFPAQGDGRRYENSTEASVTRLAQLTSPSSFMPATRLLKLVHETQYGRRYVSEKIKRGDKACRDVANYDEREGARSSFHHLKTTTS